MLSARCEVGSGFVTRSPVLPPALPYGGRAPDHHVAPAGIGGRSSQCEQCLGALGPAVRGKRLDDAGGGGVAGVDVATVGLHDLALQVAKHLPAALLRYHPERQREAVRGL